MSNSIKKVLITGGTGKFGLVLIDHFLKLGWTVVYTSTNQSKIASVQKKYPHKTNIIGYKVDFNDENFSDILISRIFSDIGPINFLVNNARKLKLLTTEKSGVTSRKNFLEEFLIDVVAVYELSICLARKQPKELQSIVNVGSQYGHVAANHNLYEKNSDIPPINYGVSKAALGHLTKELAVRFAKQNIRVNCAAFGGVAGRADKNFEERYSKLCPAGRMLREEEIIGGIEFLLTEKSSGMTGQTILIDGGWTVW